MGAAAQTTYRSEADKIRDALKLAGYKRNQVSVRQPHHSSVTVTIRDPRIRIRAIDKLARQHGEHYRTCEVSGEILQGGNTFVDVEYHDDAIAPLIAKILTVFASAPRGTLLPVGPHKAIVDGGRFDTEIRTLTWVYAGSPRDYDRRGSQLCAHGVEHGARCLAIDLLDRGLLDLDDANARRFAIDAHETSSAVTTAPRLSLSDLVLACDKRLAQGLSSADVTRVCDLPVGQWIRIEPEIGSERRLRVVPDNVNPFTVRRMSDGDVL